MLNGDGTGENFLGILQTPGIQAQAFVTDILATTRKARTKCRTPGRVIPTAYLLHPLDWEAFDLDKDAQGRYYFGGPSILGNPRLWGLPVVENESIAAGVGLDWRLQVRDALAAHGSDDQRQRFSRKLLPAEPAGDPGRRASRVRRAVSEGVCQH